MSKTQPNYCLISTSTNLFTSALIFSSKFAERKCLRENLERTWCPTAWASAAEVTWTRISEDEDFNNVAMQGNLPLFQANQYYNILVEWLSDSSLSFCEFQLSPLRGLFTVQTGKIASLRWSWITMSVWTTAWNFSPKSRVFPDTKVSEEFQSYRIL